MDKGHHGDARQRRRGRGLPITGTTTGLVAGVGLLPVTVGVAVFLRARHRHIVTVIED